MVNTLLIKTVFKYIGGIGGGLLLAWAAYVTVIRPHTKPPLPTTTQAAESIINHSYHYPRVIGGCLHIRVYERGTYENGN